MPSPFNAQTITYPLNVVITVTASNQCGFRAGMLPISLVSSNWQNVYNQLSKNVYHLFCFCYLTMYYY